jgi:thiosulfate/3-mercaptopyruvate sulfurtransferase
MKPHRRGAYRSYANPQYLVETDWLEQHLHDATLRIFDVTGMLTSKLENIAKERCYDNGHISGAVFLDVASAKGALSEPNAQLPWTWPSQEQFEVLMGRIGVSNDSQVVLYASTPRKGIDNGTMWCTRTWWVMHHFGVQCAVLNGSWEKWVAEGRSVSTSPHAYPEATFRADPQWQRGVANKEEVLAAIQTSSAMCVVDALSTASYAGTDKAVYGTRKGHITGAVNVPMYGLVDPETGVFANADELRAHFEQAGVLSAEKVITYCGGAIAATVDAFALALLGYTNVAVYDGSLFEWAADPSLPMTDPSRTG